MRRSGLSRSPRFPRPPGLLLGLEGPANETEVVAIVEMASASGLALLAPELRDPWQTTSYGTGQLIRVAAESGSAMILLGVGGSATHDLGLGALAALGLEFRTEDGQKAPPARARRTGRSSRALKGKSFPRFRRSALPAMSRIPC